MLRLYNKRDKREYFTLSVTVFGHKKRSFNPMHWIVLYYDVNCQYKMHLMYVFINVALNSVR